VFALINAQLKEAGFYRSDDAGASWSRIGHMQPPAGGAEGQAGQEGGKGRQSGGPGAFPTGGAPDDFYRGGDPQYYFELFVDPYKPDTSGR
jgi:hypothetical protein